MLEEKRQEISSAANKLRNGLWKIDDCREKVEIMSLELEEAQLKVAEFQQQCDEYLVIIVNQKKEADEQQVKNSPKKKKLFQTNIHFVCVCLERSDAKEHKNWRRGSAVPTIGRPSPS